MPPFSGLSVIAWGPFPVGQIWPIVRKLSLLLHLFPKLCPLLYLLPCELGLFRAQIPGVVFARRRPGHTV